MAIINECRAQRLQRQQELRERKLKVQETMVALQRERLTKGWQERSDRLEFVSNLQATTQEFLSKTDSSQRAEAQLLTRKLDDFARSLQQQTGEFLMRTATSRQVATRRLAQDLQDFSETLGAAIAASRQERQTQLKTIKTETQEFLSASYLKRTLAHSVLSRKLAIAVAELRSDIQSYLQELELMRENRARQLQQSFQKNRAQRKIARSALQESFTRFRTQLQEYRQSLQGSVWGDSHSHSQSSEEPRPLPVLVAPKLDELVRPTQGVAPASNLQKMPILIPPNRPAAGAIALAEGPVKETAGSALEVAKPDGTALQGQQIYEFIREGKGARLTEIETALGINRVQAVDALRSLLKEGLITQRDRTYVILESGIT